MRRLIFVVTTVILLSRVFSIAVFIGNEVLVRTTGFRLDFESVRKVLSYISSVLQDDSFREGTIGSMKYLEFRKHILLYADGIYVLDDEKIQGEGIPVDVLKIFGVEYVQDGDNVYIVDCEVLSVKEVEKTVLIDFRGVRRFDVVEDSGVLKIVAKSWLKFKQEVVPPGTILHKIDEQGLKIAKVTEEPGQVRIVLEVLTKRDYLVKNFGEKVDPYEKRVVFLIGHGDGRVIYRNYTRDLKGLDFTSYSQSKKLAQEIAQSMGYKIEECPIYDLPLGGVGLLVLVRNEQERERLLELIEKVMQQ